ncbi:hypothetical protein DPMN_175009 [Dreissena polymorpha]|uniref:Uncharacterized protein n=1 Tax=Dreissena polymorpha TaxID=45954 RepID=A0A9D4E8I5_DREPO|nr:hypothetical protein DPMN_175009 [Dreissena polymorpha]
MTEENVNGATRFAHDISAGFMSGIGQLPREEKSRSLFNLCQREKKLRPDLSGCGAPAGTLSRKGS